ncbi:uncharacterized protein NDAI_0C05080 [Naumovozyma dairenensis CBS 421]|uniref:Altered inheritance of mitochondria protein 21 n=1 Tax=Naumovozyma dairenensis (strain ATCC 10597 / BCRC 20456 / CBS 421 / NBRC 0211 / NRRL Y-12639) TaxID=1071378 RepID=G0W8Q6_NAUDC|nr:hypothetical protein NDAI_0C05080 [Naumovozyma dairenensis CBS 421]CCD24167.1 hypothetical protein NDAI_0C05080 [Naumovozyma dairenensis CBS 421]
MFGNGTNNKNKRKSYFFFGNENKPSESVHNTTKANTVTTSKPLKPKSSPTGKITANKSPLSASRNVSTAGSHSNPNLSAATKLKKPLDSTPLRNTNPFLERQETNTSSLYSLADRADPLVLPRGSTPCKDSRNPFLDSMSEPGQSQGHPARARRRPPPPLDMELVKNATQEIKLEQDHNVSELTKLSINSENTTTQESRLKSDSTIQAEPVHKPYQQHVRQRSEAEKLEDDIDAYIIQHSREQSVKLTPPRSNSYTSDKQFRITNSSSSNDNIPDLRPWTDTSGDMITPEYPLMYTPHFASAEDRNDHDIKEKPLEDDTDRNKDRFSFTTSVSEKSVRSIPNGAVNLKVQNDSPILPASTPAIKDLPPEQMHMLNDDENSIQQSEENIVLRIANNDLTKSVSNKPEEDSYDGNPSRSFTKMSTASSSSNSSSAFLSHKDDINQRDESFESDDEHRQFRVVNEDRPNFYMDGDDSMTMDNEDKQTVNTEHSSASSYNYEVAPKNTKGLKIDGQHTQDDSSSISTNPSIMNNIPTLLSSEHASLTNTPILNKEENLGSPPVKLQVNTDTPALSASLSTPSKRSLNTTITSQSLPSPKAEKMGTLVSSYVEELRLKYYKTSNFLQAPPNLPSSLKQKNNIIQPKNIRVRIRTSSKQIGIKHGKVKQKLLTLETTNEESNDLNGTKLNVDHTKEFHKLLNKENSLDGPSNSSIVKDVDFEEDFMKEIPGDEAYDSDDAMAPLREKKKNNINNNPSKISRNNTVVSYYTKKLRKNGAASGNDYAANHELPTDIPLDDYKEKQSFSSNKPERSDSTDSNDSNILDMEYSLGKGLHVANPDSD